MIGWYPAEKIQTVTCYWFPCVPGIVDMQRKFTWRNGFDFMMGSWRGGLAAIFFVVALQWAMHSTLRADDREIPANLPQEARQLVERLNDPSYRVRREAFIRLCDPAIPVDEWLDQESKDRDAKRSSIAKWLIRLRRSSGSMSERFEALSDYQTVLEGDDSPLTRLVSSGNWERAIELMQVIPSGRLRQTLLEQGTLGLFIQQAWQSRNEWAIPKMINLSLEPERRVHVNRWWRTLGMPDDWKVDEPDEPAVQLSRLQADGKVDEALQFAKANGMVNKVEEIIVQAGDWDRWLELDPRKTMLMGGSQSDVQRLFILLMVNRVPEAKKVWEKLKSQSNGASLPGYATMAIVMEDEEYLQKLLKKMRGPEAFELLYGLGRLEEAFAAVGLKEWKPEALKKWLRLTQPLSRAVDESNPGSELMLRLYSVAFHQSGDEEMEKMFDDHCLEILRREETSPHERTTSLMLSVWSTVSNQRQKGIDYLKAYCKRRLMPRLMSGRKATAETGSDSKRDAKERDLFDILYVHDGAKTIADSLSVYEYLYKQLSSERPDVPMEEMVDEVFGMLEELHAGRLPKQWKDTEPLKEMYAELRERDEDEDGEGELEFAMAKLFDLLGDTEYAMTVLQDSLASPPHARLMARFLAKTGQIGDAATLTQAMVNRGNNNGIVFLETADLLERAGKFSELDTLRIQQLASTYSTTYLGKDRMFPDSDELLESRIEVRLLLERSRRISGNAAQLGDVDLRFQEAKKDLSNAPAAYNLAANVLFQASRVFPQLEERRTRQYLDLVIPSIIANAIAKKDRETAELWLNIAHRIEPSEIDLMIDIYPLAEKNLGPEVANQWYDLYYNWLVQWIEKRPRDAMTLNNTAWLSALCNRNLDKAKEFSTRAVELRNDPTYMDTLAEVEFRLGNFERAMEISQKCRELEPRETQHRKQVRRFSKAIAERAAPSQP
jgi:tetratricopeptide (TPR) repeat protein